jgi:hypothetical protein
MVTSRHKSERVARAYIERETLHERGAGERLVVGAAHSAFHPADGELATLNAGD